MIRRSVDFPLPFGPAMTSTSPFAAAAFMSENTVRRPNRRQRPVSVTFSSAGGFGGAAGESGMSAHYTVAGVRRNWRIGESTPTWWAALGKRILRSALNDMLAAGHLVTLADLGTVMLRNVVFAFSEV